MVIAIGGTKQGSGVTTLCVHLATWLVQHKGINPLIIDAAENPDIQNFFHYRLNQWKKNPGADILEFRDTTDDMALYEKIKEKKELYEYIIIDCGNRIMTYKPVLMIADRFVCPIKADPIYIEHADNLLDHVMKLNNIWERLYANADILHKETALQAYSILNLVDDSFRDGLQIAPDKDGVFQKVPFWYETGGRIRKSNNIHNCMQYNLTVYDTYSVTAQETFNEIFSNLIP